MSSKYSSGSSFNISWLVLGKFWNSHNIRLDVTSLDPSSLITNHITIPPAPCPLLLQPLCAHLHFVTLVFGELCVLLLQMGFMEKFRGWKSWESIREEKTFKNHHLFFIKQNAGLLFTNYVSENLAIQLALKIQFCSWHFAVPTLMPTITSNDSIFLPTSFTMRILLGNWFAYHKINVIPKQAANTNKWVIQIPIKHWRWSFW